MEEKVKQLIFNGYRNTEIKRITGLQSDKINQIRKKYNIISPTSEELAARGIYYTWKGRRETDLTTEKLIELLDSGKTISEISRIYKLNMSVINRCARNLGWEDEKLKAAKETKRKLIILITGKEPEPEDLKKSFLRIFTKEYILDLLVRNEYSLKGCSKELGGIDPKCIAEAARKFEIEIPEDLDYKRKFQASHDSKTRSYSKKFEKFIETYFPDLEIVEGYRRGDKHVLLRCKLHPSEIIRITPEGLKSNYTRQKEDGTLEVLNSPCKICKKIKEEKEKLKKISEELESRFPGKFDLSQATLIKKNNLTCIKNVKCNKCGELFTAYASQLKKNGVCRVCESVISYGERRVKKSLKELGIPFISQEFKSGVVPKDIRKFGISIDFWIENYEGKEIWIEYNGQQHYNYIKRFHTSQEEFINQVLRDRWVRKYCEENEILYIEIPYTYNSYEKILELLKKILINKEDPNSLIDYEPLMKEIKTILP